MGLSRVQCSSPTRPASSQSQLRKLDHEPNFRFILIRVMRHWARPEVGVK